MNIKLIFPPSTSQNHTANPILSLGVLKAYLDKKNISTDIEDLEILVKDKSIDLKIFNDKQIVFKYLLKNMEDKYLNTALVQIMSLSSLNNFDMIGFSIMGIRQFLISLCLAKKIKKQFKSKIILGGFYPQSNAVNIMKNFNFVDYIVEKEGEIALEILTKQEDVKQTPFLYYREKNKIRKSNIKKYININELPPLDFSGLPLNIYKKYRNYLEIPYELSRGCISNCNFCSFPKHGGLRTKEIHKIIKDLRELKERYNTNRFIFYNSEINISKIWIKEFLNNLISSKLNLEWTGYLIPNIDEETAVLLKKSKCIQLKIGIESGSDITLKKMGKIHRIIEAKKTIRLLSEYNLNAYYFFVTGYLYETRKEHSETIKFIIKYKKYIKIARVTIFELEYNTNIFNASKRYGIIRKRFKQNLILPTLGLPFDEGYGLKWKEKIQQQIKRKIDLERLFKKLDIITPREFCS